MGSDWKEVDEEGALLGHARLVYRGLSHALAEAIKVLQAKIEDPVSPKTLLEVLRDHRKALQTVIDIEVGLGKRSKDSGDSGGPELDLAAARDEIHRRIALLRDTGEG